LFAVDFEVSGNPERSRVLFPRQAVHFRRDPFEVVARVVLRVSREQVSRADSLDRARRDQRRLGGLVEADADFRRAAALGAFMVKPQGRRRDFSEVTAVEDTAQDEADIVDGGGGQFGVVGEQVVHHGGGPLSFSSSPLYSMPGNLSRGF